MSIIDSLFVALGFKVDDAGLFAMRKKADEARESMMGLGHAIAGIAAGFALHKLAEIGSTFEQNQIQIAGFLSALGQSSDFNAGLKDAAQVIQQITNDAAKLPGEADEYIEVFKAGLPFVQKAMPGGSLADITKFTNQLTAIGKTFGLDAGLIAREFDHMLTPGRGTAGLRLPLFRQLLPFMQQVKGQAHITAESFNAMTAPKRLELLQSTFAQLQPMLDASATSFDAMYGAVVSMVKQVARLGSASLFGGMKKALDRINAIFLDADGNLTEFGKSAVGVFGAVSRIFARVLTDGVELIEMMSKSKAAGIALKFVMGLLAAQIAALALGPLVRLARGLLYIKGIINGGLILAIGLIAEDLYQFYTGGNSVTGMLVKKFGPALLLIKALLAALVLTFLQLNAPGVLVLFGRTIGFIGVMFGRTMALIMPLIARIIALGFTVLTTGARMLIGWLIGLGPIGLIILGLVAIGAAIYALWRNFDRVMAFIRKNWALLVPLLFTGIGPILALILGVIALGKHWDQVVSGMEKVWERFTGKLKSIKDEVSGFFGFGDNGPADAGLLAPGGGVLAAAGAPTSSDYAPIAFGSAAGGGGSANTTNVHVDRPQITVVTNDPEAAGRAVHRELTRNAQSKKAY
jgi:hypothetical protein